MKPFALALLLPALAMAGPAIAQTPPGADGRCWHASQSYSAGSLVRVGGKFYACAAAGDWAEAESGGANCVYEDRNYSTGALVAVGGTLIACEASGAWVGRGE